MATLGWVAYLANGKIARQGEYPYMDLFTKGFSVREFIVWQPETEEVLVRVGMEDKDRVIYRRRVTLTLSAETNKEVAPGVVVWQIILQRPRTTLSGWSGDFDYFQVGIDEATCRAARRAKNDFSPPLDFPELFSWELEAGVLRPKE